MFIIYNKTNSHLSPICIQSFFDDFGSHFSISKQLTIQYFKQNNNNIAIICLPAFIYINSIINSNTCLKSSDSFTMSIYIYIYILNN